MNSGVAYAKADLTVGQTWQDVEHSIRTITAEHGDVIMWFFDFVCTREQIVTVDRMAQHAYTLIETLCPALKPSHIVIGASEPGDDRPAREVMLGIAANQPARIILKGLKLENGKRLLWVGGELTV